MSLAKPPRDDTVRFPAPPGAFGEAPWQQHKRPKRLASPKATKEPEHSEPCQSAISLACDGLIKKL